MPSVHSEPHAVPLHSGEDEYCQAPNGIHFGKPARSQRPRLAVRSLWLAMGREDRRISSRQTSATQQIQGQPGIHDISPQSKSENKQGVRCLWMERSTSFPLASAHMPCYTPGSSPSPMSGRLCVAGERTSGFVVVAQEGVCPGCVATVVLLVRSSSEVGSQVQEG